MTRIYCALLIFLFITCINSLYGSIFCIDIFYNTFPNWTWFILFGITFFVTFLFTSIHSVVLIRFGCYNLEEQIHYLSYSLLNVIMIGESVMTLISMIIPMFHKDSRLFIPDKDIISLYISGLLNVAFNIMIIMLSHFYKRLEILSFNEITIPIQVPFISILVSGMCSICLQTDDSNLITTLCGHTFHEHCINEWAIQYRKQTCPMCRKNLFMKDV